MCNPSSGMCVLKAGRIGKTLIGSNAAPVKFNKHEPIFPYNIKKLRQLWDIFQRDMYIYYYGRQGIIKDYVQHDFELTRAAFGPGWKVLTPALARKFQGKEIDVIMNIKHYIVAYFLNMVFGIPQILGVKHGLPIRR